jgi:hypothetical protein
LRHIRQELQTNRGRVEAYLIRLEQRVEELFDFARFDGPDWEWRLPQLAGPVLDLHVWHRERTLAEVLPTDLRAQLDSLYAELSSLPPDVSSWADEWSGEELGFYAFLRGKIRQYCEGLRRRMGELDQALNVP